MQSSPVGFHRGKRSSDEAVQFEVIHGYSSLVADRVNILQLTDSVV